MTFAKANKKITIVLIFAFSFFCIQNILFYATAYAQASAEKLLKKGKEQFENAEFDVAIVTLKQAIEAGLKEEIDKIEVHKYLAYCYSAFRDTENAKQKFLNILELNPQFDLSITEPQIYRDLLKLAQNEFISRDTAGPVIIFDPPVNVNENNPVEIKAKVSDKTGIKSVDLFYKKASEQNYSRLPMERIEEDQFRVSIPSVAITIDGLELYIQAKDKANNSLANYGTKDDPIKISVSSLDQQSPIIEHTAIISVLEKTPIEITAKVTDRSGLKDVILYFKKTEDNSYKKSKMESIENDVYSSKIEEKYVTSEDIVYYQRSQ